jgi:hypothetical protein
MNWFEIVILSILFGLFAIFPIILIVVLHRYINGGQNYDDICTQGNPFHICKKCNDKGE